MKNKFVDFKVLATSLCCSVVMGLISFAFLKCLDYAADFRSFFPLCYIFLPVAGIVTAFVYKRIGGKSSMGNNIIIESANDGEKVPKRLASLTFIFTCITHLFGGSVGREGTAVQIGGSLTSNVADYLGFKNNDRSTIVLSGISSAFGSVFGTPFAGAFFGMEVCCVGRLSAGAVIPCFACSYLANFVTQLLGFKHERYAISSIPDFDARFLFVFLIAAVCLGLIGKLFALGIKYVKLAYSKIFKNYLLAAAVGAAVVSLLILTLGLNDFEGLSTWMQDTAFKGDAKWYDMPAKYLLTVLTLGAGFQGGEVTPMFDMGASFGSWFGGVCGFDPTFFAAIGFVCVFAAAINTPITAIVLGIEVFGASAAPYFVLAVLISFIASGNTTIYPSQKFLVDKSLFHFQKK